MPRGDSGRSGRGAAGKGAGGKGGSKGGGGGREGRGGGKSQAGGGRGKQGRDTVRKAESDRSLYKEAGKGKNPGKLKEIPTRELKELMKRDKDSWRAGAAAIELSRRERARAKPSKRDR